MTVAHVITRMIIGGAQENTLLSVLGLQEKHYDVTLITGEETGPEGRLDLSQVKQCLFIPDLVRDVYPFRDIKAFAGLYRLFKSRRYDVVHTHSSKAGILARWAAFFAGIPVIIHTVHGLPFHRFQNRWVNLLYRWLEKLAGLVTRKIIVVSPEMSRICIRYRIAPASKFETVFSGMVTAPFLDASQKRDANRLKLKLSADDIVIGTIARLSPMKGHEQILSVAEDVIRANPKIRFLWIGDGWIADRLKQQILDAGISEYFIFTGLVNPSEIPFYTSVMDILVHTSLREGLARAIPQAFLCKVPVISYAIDGAVDIIRHSENGFLLDCNDREGLKKSILKLAENNELRRSMALRGHKEVIQAFDHRQMTDHLERIYLTCHC